MDIRLTRMTAILVAVGAATLAAAVKDEGSVDPAVRSGWSPYAIGLWGDLPYSPLQETVGVPNLIADMNAQRLAFTVHDGDLKQGCNSPCDAALYARSLAYFNSLEAPAMFTPGDNDWTDCDRPSNGGSWSLERLDYERQVFFAGSAAAAAGRTDGGPLPRDRRLRAVRREPPVELPGGHLRDDEHPGVVQQPMRYGARSRRV